MIYPEEVVDIKEWFTCEIPRKEYKKLMKRDNYHGAINFTIFFLLLGGTGYLAYRSIGTWLMVPAFLLYGFIYSGNNTRWHECSHGTVFKTSWINVFFYWLFGSMEIADNVTFQWSHSRHHSYTIISPIDPEDLVTESPTNLFKILLGFVSLPSYFKSFMQLICHSLGFVSKRVKAFVPESEYKKMFWWSRASLLPHLIALALSLYYRSWLPLVFYSFPKLYGNTLMWSFILLQHVGLDKSTWDHRSVCRSFKVNRFMSFMLMNMECHTEHHMYPLVPYHALPKLQEMIKDQLPEPYVGLLPAFIEMMGALIKQRKNPDYYIERVGVLYE